MGSRGMQRETENWEGENIDEEYEVAARKVGWELGFEQSCLFLNIRL